jgi:protein TonB
VKLHITRRIFTFSILSVALFASTCLPAQVQTSTRRIIKKVEPVYPALLRERGIGGTVRLKVIVRADGTVRDVQVQGGNPILAESAVRAVKEWRYSAGESESTAEVVIHFGNDQ